MGRIAAWLVEHPRNGIIALIIASITPLSSMLSALIIGFLLLASSLQMVLFQGVATLGALSVLAIAAKASVMQMVAGTISWWLPVIGLIAVLKRTRSVTLMVQLSIVLLIAGVTVFYVLVGDVEAYWLNFIPEIVAEARELGLTRQAEVFETSQEFIVPHLTRALALFIWLALTSLTLLAYALYQKLPGKEARCGRFCDLNLGTVLAIVMAVTSLTAVFVGDWLETVSFLLFSAFWLQGLAILHWMTKEKRLPWAVLAATYVGLPFLNAVLITAFAIFGYIDAWFNFRKTKASAV